MSRSYKRPYTKAKAVDKTCRCHGSCSYCLGNRMYKNEKHPDLKEEIKIMQEKTDKDLDLDLLNLAKSLKILIEDNIDHTISNDTNNEFLKSSLTKIENYINEKEKSI